VDIYDGDDGEPMITHGGTLTSTTTVRDVSTAIAKYAFISSPYPIIISAEIHCGIVQQKRLTEIFAHAFGEALVIAPVDEGHKEGDEIKCLPSPEQLKGRILLKAKNKYIDATRPKIQKLPDEPPSSDDSENEVKHSGLRDKFNQMWKRTPPKNLTPHNSKRPDTSSVPVISASPQVSSSFVAPSQTEGQPRKILMAPELLPLLVYTMGVSFRGLSPAQAYHITHLFSLSEPRANSLVHSGADALRLVDHTREHLVRVYPKGTRVNSSNFVPHQYWACGCQLVTVNWQTVG
jgi:phosphatidylinositol phospholipase C delta